MKYFLFLIIILSFACYSKIDNTKPITIQPIGNYDIKLLDSLQSKIQQFYDVEVVINNPIKMPKRFFINVKSPRYRADSIIRFLRETKPDSVSYIIGITNHDISTTKKDKSRNVKKPVSKYTDWGIFGLGFCPGPSCVVSTFRMGNNKQIRLERAQKVSLHELGHNMGLPHCLNNKCFMQDAAETIKTVDNVQFNLCEKCKNKIGYK